MKLVSFTAQGRRSFGIAVGTGVHDLGARLGPVVPDLRTLLQVQAVGATFDFSSASAADFSADEFAWDPVITNPGKIICVGHNYEEHRRETERDPTAHPSVFIRFADTLIGHEAPIVRPAVSHVLDYEGELAVVIGRAGWRVPEESAMSLVAGYTVCNEASVRDWQRHTIQFTPGKNFPGTCPLGPALVTADEIDGLDHRAITTTLNGTVVQQATLGDMIFNIAEIIAYVTAFTRLAPGDVIVTGTPGGVGFKRTPPLLMKPGDTVEVTVEGVGTLRNGIVDETGA
ncbi:fumarylacetoacetate hydrolase family protein [Rhodoplanes roseus]|uniref:5-oxopent-3-ene-1,2,5-tricarboxylate decarboxylase n=1 Tax=Rhodoplanes roseus TaxID=29409 RepID=A0A327KR45_9BRAD|nr:fumarylacetoacetate hydrolase family protein [Rhodoplanes roseus]RAI40103.1 5-oxopent-3-ene-1,2,5-tricarboxylate decarboxylase [Rhodoplanes roseus]